MNKYTLRQTPLAVAIGTLLAGGAVHAATITVTTDADGPLGSITEDCTLRAAVESANTDTPVDGCVAGDVGADEIVFDESLAHSTITLGEGQMVINDTLTITGPVPGDAAGLVIDGNQQSRIFRTVADLGLDSLTLTGGHTSTGGYGDGGGAIYAFYANLSLAHVMVTGNSTGGGSASGGGLLVVGGNVTLVNSTVSGNSTTGNFASGGGLRSYGNVTLVNSTVSGNSTTGNDAGGGGLLVVGGNVTLSHSTVSGNSTDGFDSSGGGLLVVIGNATLTHSTVSGNSTAGDNAHGGGLYVKDGDATLVNSTVSGNSTGGLGAQGGGLYVRDGDATLVNSTVAYNTADDGTDGVDNAYSTLTLNNSLIVQAGLGETACSQTAAYHTNTLVTGNSCTGTSVNPADIALGPLADNGGPTQTHALDAGSVAIDGAGDCQSEFDVSDDQRGEPRPGFSSAACDIGAYEAQFPPELGPTVLDFGAVRVGLTTGPQTVTFNNPGTVDMEIATAGPVTGPGAAAFAISADACTGVTLPPGGSCDVGIEFTPDDRMQFDAQVGFQFASGSAEAALTGTGIAPVMGLLPPTLDFGSVAVDEAGGPLSLEVINSGDDLLEVAALLGLVEPFSLASSGTCGAFPFTLTPGGQCTLGLQFTPTVVGGAKQAVFVSSDSFGGHQAFALRGLGFSIDDEIFEDRFEP